MQNSLHAVSRKTISDGIDFASDNKAAGVGGVLSIKLKAGMRLCANLIADGVGEERARGVSW